MQMGSLNAVIGAKVALNARGYTWPGVFHGGERARTGVTPPLRTETRPGVLVLYQTFIRPEIHFGDVGIPVISSLSLQLCRLCAGRATIVPEMGGTVARGGYAKDSQIYYCTEHVASSGTLLPSAQYPSESRNCRSCFRK
jgi:hypothetical protein